MARLFRRGGRWLALLTGAVVLVGCGPAKVPVHPVRGQVFFRNKPAARALVLCHPVSGGLPPGAAMPPHGRVQADGSFTLTTFADNDGAPAGEYVVVILAEGGGGEEGDPEDAPRTARPLRLPEEYGDAATSPLRREVQPGENVWEPIHLK